MSYLDDYRILSSGNEAPAIFHEWCGISSISHLVSRKVWTDMGVYTAYPNMYIILVGNPGDKKTTAMRIAQKLVFEFPNIAVGGTSMTKEAIIKTMAENPECLKKVQVGGKTYDYSHLSFFANEFTNLIGTNSAGMIDFFTDAWDQDLLRDTTKGKGDFSVKGPYITILGCMTIDSARGLIAQRVIHAGMSRRCIFISGKGFGQPIPFPTLTEAQIEARKRLLVKAKAITLAAGEFKWDQAARDIYEEIYKANFSRIKNETSVILKYFLETKPSYIIKVAMCLALSEDPKDLVLRPEYIVRANELVTAVENGGQFLFEGTGRNELAATASVIARKLDQAEEPVKYVALRAEFFRDVTPKELEDIMNHLVAIRRVYKFIDVGQVVWYCNKKVYDMILDHAKAQESKTQDPMGQ